MAHDFEVEKVTIMNTVVRRFTRLINTLSHKTFPHNLHLLTHWSGATNNFFGMNHDFVRASIILKLLETLGVDVFIETGTHLGRTCFLIGAQTDLPVFSCEANQKYLRTARWLLKPFGSRIKLSNSDSVMFLSKLLAQQRFKRPLFYLDAHWYSKLPLVDELRTIMKLAGSFIVVIDDFRVEDDLNFGFDCYGSTVLEWGLIEQVMVGSGRRMVAYSPAYRSSIEVGDRRGWILIASMDNQAAIRDAVPTNLLDVHAFVDESGSVTSSQMQHI